MSSTTNPVRRRNVDHDVAHARAVKAATARTSLDHYVSKVVAAAPELSASQRDALATALRGAA